MNGLKNTPMLWGGENKADKIKNGRINRMIPDTIKTPEKHHIKPHDDDTEEIISIERRGYDYTQNRTLYGLCFMISADKGRDIEEFEQLRGAETIHVSRYVERKVSLSELCYLIFGDRRSKNIVSILKDIYILSRVQYSWTYKTKGQNKIKLAPILGVPEISFNIDDIMDFIKSKYGITIGSNEISLAYNRWLFDKELSEVENDIMLLAIEDIKKEDYIPITFGRPFFEDNAYISIPAKLLRAWGKNGTANIIHPFLINHIVSGYSKSIYLNNTASILLTTIDVRVEGDFFANNNTERLKKYIIASMEQLKDIGMIKDYRITGRGNSAKLEYSYNKNYNKQLKTSDPEA